MVLGHLPTGGSPGMRSSFSSWIGSAVSNQASGQQPSQSTQVRTPTVQGVELLGEVQVPNKKGALCTAFPIMVRPVGDTGRKIVQRSITDFEKLHRALRKRAGHHSSLFSRARPVPGMDLPPLPRADDGDRKEGLHAWLTVILAVHPLWCDEVRCRRAHSRHASLRCVALRCDAHSRSSPTRARPQLAAFLGVLHLEPQDEAVLEAGHADASSTTGAAEPPPPPLPSQRCEDAAPAEVAEEAVPTSLARDVLAASAASADERRVAGAAAADARRAYGLETELASCRAELESTLQQLAAAQDRCMSLEGRLAQQALERVAFSARLAQLEARACGADARGARDTSPANGESVCSGGCDGNDEGSGTGGETAGDSSDLGVGGGEHQAVQRAELLEMHAELESVVVALCTHLGLVWDSSGVADTAYTPFGAAREDSDEGDEEAYEEWAGDGTSDGDVDESTMGREV